MVFSYFIDPFPPSLRITKKIGETRQLNLRVSQIKSVVSTLFHVDAVSSFSFSFSSFIDYRFLV